MLATRYPLAATRLRSYFYSGWAFLIPYLVVYLLYYATKWPVNGSIRSQMPEASNQIVKDTWVPCMLHVYWALHAIHVILAGVALWSWWTSYRSKVQGPCTKGQDHTPPPDVVVGALTVTPTRPTSDLRSPASGLWPLAIHLAPWALLALLFYIPGVYLEWPSDPWEHLRRINEWRILDTVGAHSSWMKSAYFIPYSLLSWCIGLRQLFWLDFYYTGICLLLCWQYYRFSRACGLGEHASMVFVIIQALLFGNNVFSFYRYYGISSSIYAQLGAIALTRLVLEFAAKGTNLDPKHSGIVSQRQRSSDSEVTEDAGSSTIERAALSAERSSASADSPSPLTLRNRLSALAYSLLATRYSLLISVPSLIAFTALNHNQGLGIAGLGITAIIVWRLIEWRRNALCWLIGGTIVINGLLLWLYPRPAIIETYRAQGWLNAWYGFNILDITSHAGDRMLQVISIFGLINLGAGFILLRSSRIGAWLTIVPILVCLLPFFSIPFAELVGERFFNDIITFQRMLFSVPIALAIVEVFSLHASSLNPKSHSLYIPNALALIKCLRQIHPAHLFRMARVVPQSKAHAHRWPTTALHEPRCLVSVFIHQQGVFCVSLLVLTAAVTSPAGRMGYSRTWHSLSYIPDDRRLSPLLAGITAEAALSKGQRFVMTTSIPAFLVQMQLPNRSLAWGASARHYALTGRIPIDDGPAVKNEARSPTTMRNSSIILFTPSSFTTCYSQAALLSQHWPPQDAVLSTSGTKDLAKICLELGLYRLEYTNWILFLQTEPTPLTGKSN